MTTITHPDSSVKNLFLNRDSILKYISGRHVIFDSLAQGMGGDLLYFSIKRDDKYEIDWWKTKDEIAAYLETLNIKTGNSSANAVGIIIKEFNSRERVSQIVTEVFKTFKKYFKMGGITNPELAKANSIITDKDIEAGWQLDKARKEEIVKSIKYNTIEAKSYAIIVDGFESISPGAILDDIITDLFINGSNNDIAAFLEILNNVMNQQTQKNPEEKQIRKKIIELFDKTAIQNTRMYKAKWKEKNAQLISNSRGMPYFTKGEEWPTKEEKPLEYIFQIVNNGNINLPDHIGILQVYITDDESLIYQKPEALHIKTYAKISEKDVTLIERPYKEYADPYLIDFKADNSLPGLSSSFRSQVIKLIKEIDSMDYQEIYQKYWQKYVKDKNAWRYVGSFIGGYPKWVQYDEEFSEEWQFILQIDSDITDLPGVLYLYYNKETQKFKYALQSS
jgi:uncharacterized protein YwqG